MNFLIRSRDNASNSVDEINAVTVKILLSARNAPDFSAKIEPYFKNVSKVISRLGPDLFSILSDIDIISPSLSRTIIKNGSLAKANSYFRCLSAYMHAAARETNFSQVDASLNLYNSTLKTLCESCLPGLLVDLEQASLLISILVLRWHAWSNNSATDSFSKIFETAIENSVSALNAVSSLKGNFHIFEKGLPTDEYHVMTRLCSQLKEWPEILMKNKPSSTLRLMSSESKRLLRELHSHYTCIYEKCHKEEIASGVAPQLHYFKNQNLMSIAHGTAAILAIDSGDMDLGSAYFEKAEGVIRSNACWHALKQFYQQLHLAVGVVAEVPSRIHLAINWMSQSCKIQKEYYDRFPSEKTNELATKLGFLASLESRALTSKNTTKTSSNKSKEDISNDSDSQKQENSNSSNSAAISLSTAFKSDWMPTDLYPIIDLYLKKQLKALGSNAADSSKLKFFFDGYQSKVTKERSLDYFKLLEFESSFLLNHGRPAAQMRLITNAMKSEIFTSEHQRARMLLLRAIGHKKSIGSGSNSNNNSKGSKGSEENDTSSSFSESDSKGSQSIANDLLDAINLLSERLDAYEGEEEGNENSRVLADLALAQTMQAICMYEAPSSTMHYLDTSSSNLSTLEDVVDSAFELYSKVLGRMLSIYSAGEESSTTKTSSTTSKNRGKSAKANESEETPKILSRSLLEQNRTHWTTIEVILDQLILLRDLLHFRGDHRRYIAVSKILLKIFATLIPFGNSEHGERVRTLTYAQIGSSFHELGYDDPLATKYFAKSGASDETNLIQALLKIQKMDVKFNEEFTENKVKFNENLTPKSVLAETSDWLILTTQFLHDMGKIPEFDYIGHLEMVSDRLDSEMEETSNLTRFAFLQQVRASIHFTLAQIKSTSGRIDEAIIDALIAFRMRAPSAPKKISSPADTKQSLLAPPYWKSSCWRFIKNFMDSMDQLGRLYGLQGSFIESRYYYTMALQLAQKHENKYYEFHFNVMMAQLDLDSSPSMAEGETNSENFVFDPATQVSGPLSSESISLTMASAYMVKGNRYLENLSLDEALENFSESEKILLSLIESKFLQTLDSTENDEQNVNNAKSASRSGVSRGKTTAAKKSSSANAATEIANNSKYRFSMSPAKIPKCGGGALPKVFFGLKRIQLRIAMKLATIDYERARQIIANRTSKQIVEDVDTEEEEEEIKTSNRSSTSKARGLTKVDKKTKEYSAAEYLELASKRLESTKREFEEIPAQIEFDLALVMLLQAKVLISQYEEDLNTHTKDTTSSHWDYSASGNLKTKNSSASSGAQSSGSSTSSKKSSSSTSQGIDRLLMARETLNSAFSLSIASGSVPKVTSDICQYFVDVHGTIDPWVTVARQNSAIGVTMRHQILENLFRLGIHKVSSEGEDPSEENQEDDEVNNLASELESKVNIEEGKGEKENDASIMASILSEMEFNDDKMGGEEFKNTFVDILGSTEETKPYTVVTLSLGPNFDSLVLSRLQFGENPLVVRIDLTKPIDENTERMFNALADAGEEENEEKEENQSIGDMIEDSGLSPALKRSATAILAPLLKSSTSTSSSTAKKTGTLKRSASSVQSMSSGSKLSSSGLSSSDTPITSLSSTSSSGAKASGTGVRAKRSSSTSTTSSSAPKKTSSSSRTRKPIDSIEELTSGDLEGILSKISISPSADSDTSDELLSSSSISSSQSSSTCSKSSLSNSSEEGRKEEIFDFFLKQFDSIISDSKSNAVTTAMKNEDSIATKEFNFRWWSKRYALDDRLNFWLSNFEDCILSPYKTLLAGRLADSKLEASLDAQASDLKAKIEKILKISAGAINGDYFRCLLLGCDTTHIRDIMESLRILCGWSEAQGVKNAKILKNAAQLLADTTTSLSSSNTNTSYRFEQSQAESSVNLQYKSENDEKENDENVSEIPSQEGMVEGSNGSHPYTSKIVKRNVRRQKRYPVILILDKNLHTLPWESLPTLRSNPVSRMASIYSLRTSILSMLDSDASRPNVVRDGIDVSKLFYVLNPSKDLVSSQETLQPILEKSNTLWNGITAVPPTLKDYAGALSNSNLFLYAGHNSGSQYLHGESSELRKVRSIAGGCVVWMMGCSSLKFRNYKNFDSSGLGLTLLLSGAPSVVGNLWDVTTRDLDKATLSLLDWLKRDQKQIKNSNSSNSSSSDSSLESNHANLNREGKNLSSLSLNDAIILARKECKLEFINAAALISYGLPVRVNRSTCSNTDTKKSEKSNSANLSTSKSCTSASKKTSSKRTSAAPRVK